MGPILNLIRKVRVEANAAHHHFSPVSRDVWLFYSSSNSNARTYLPFLIARARTVGPRSTYEMTLFLQEMWVVASLFVNFSEFT